MGPIWILLLVLQFLYTTTLSKVLNSPLSTGNSINDKLKDYSLFLPSEFSNENDEFQNGEDIWAGITDIPDADADADADANVPLVQTFEDKTVIQFREPIESINVDNSRNAIILKFHKSNSKSVVELDQIENENKKAGKRSYEEFSSNNSLDGGVDKSRGLRLERSQQNVRDARGDNFMRFGRSNNMKNDFMRFGRGGSDFMRFGRSPSQGFMRFGRASGTDNFMRFGRAADQDFMRFGRAAPSQDFMRFGRTPGHDFMRFGRTPSQDFMRFGRSPNQDFMRFGRNAPKKPKNKNFVRYSRPDNFMRFGRTPQLSDNFQYKNDSKPLKIKNELKQAMKQIHESDKNAANKNPVDKAIKVLFDKHQQLDPTDNARSDELNGESTYQHNELDSADSELY